MCRRLIIINQEALIGNHYTGSTMGVLFFMKKNKPEYIKKYNESVGYTKIPTKVAQNHNLSLTARGLLFYLMSMPPTWVASKSQIISLVPEGKCAVRNAFKELESCGHIKQVKLRKDGRINYAYEVSPYTHLLSTEYRRQKTASSKLSAVNGTPIDIVQVETEQKEIIHKETIQREKEKFLNKPSFSSVEDVVEYVTNGNHIALTEIPSFLFDSVMVGEHGIAEIGNGKIINFF